MSDYIKKEDAANLFSKLAFGLRDIQAEDVIPATIEGALGYLHKVGWMQEHDRIMTEDTVPVVRCKDCKHCNTDWAMGKWYGSCKEWNTHSVMADWYCVNGERKDDE